MLEYNNDHIFTGYLKQLLKDFNLPKYFRNEWPLINQSNYVYNKKVINQTKNLEIKNNIYDSYTHNYLGEYLRFLRDYSKLDLMPLYNCFSNEIPNNLSIDGKELFKENPTDAEFLKQIKFNSADKNYKIYMLPVKFNKNYTIALESPLPVEICCGIYGKYLYTDYNTETTTKDLIKNTYTRYTYLIFSQPILFNKLNFIENSSSKEKLYSLESNLKLFIKIPANINTSITVLEGDYRNYNDSFYKTECSEQIKYTNQYITNYEVYSEDSTIPISIAPELLFKPITALQLLATNTGTSYPFADRLMAYLLDNTITHLEKIPDNIKRLQKNINGIYYTGSSNNKIYTNEVGGWSAIYRPLLYDTFNIENKNNVYLLNHDILGYIDKDTEKLFNNGKLLSTDIYDELYKDDKGKK